MCGYIGKIFFNDPIKSEFDFLVYTLYLLIWKKSLLSVCKTTTCFQAFFFFNLFQDNFKSLKGSIRKGGVSITNICYKEANFTLTVKKYISN